MTRRRYTAEEREQAAVLCSIAACDRGILDLHSGKSTYDFARDLGYPFPAQALADDAFWCAMRSELITIFEIYAEAEALIRTGWSPW